MMSEKQLKNGRACDRRKKSIYMTQSMLDEVQAEATRLGRPLSWLMHRVWEIAREDIKRIPGQ